MTHGKGNPIKKKMRVSKTRSSSISKAPIGRKRSKSGRVRLAANNLRMLRRRRLLALRRARMTPRTAPGRRGNLRRRARGVKTGTTRGSARRK